MTQIRLFSLFSLAMLLGVGSPSLLCAEAARPVTLAEVEREVMLERVSLTGSTIPWRRADLSVQVDGLVTELFVDDGSLVQAGDPILALDARLAELDVQAGQARLQEALTRHQDALRLRDELLELKRSQHASKTEIQSAIAQVEIAAAELSGARVSLARARQLLDLHRLAAPFAGMVVARQVEVGEWLKRDQAAVGLVALDKLRIRAQVPQSDYTRVETGARVTVRFDALPERTFEGVVQARIASGDERSRTFPLLIDLANPQRLLAPGMSARVEVELNGDRSAALTVPRDALLLKSDGSREVWRLRNEAGQTRAYPLTVEIGRANGTRLEVFATGLQAGDRVVLLGNERLSSGQLVEVSPGTPAPARDGQR